MSITYLSEVYEIIRAENVMIPVIALGIFKRQQANDDAGAYARRERCLENYGIEFVNRLDICVLFFTMYGVPQEACDAAQR